MLKLLKIGARVFALDERQHLYHLTFWRYLPLSLFQQDQSLEKRSWPVAKIDNCSFSFLRTHLIEEKFLLLSKDEKP